MKFYLTDGIFHRKGYPPEPTPQSISFEIPDDATEITVPDGTTSIWRCTFSDCRKVEKIRLPDSVSYIGIQSFSGCTALEEITLPDRISAIGSRAFQGCLALHHIALPPCVTSVAEYTFSGCSSLQSVELPDGIRSISREAFSRCTALKHICIPKSVTTIGRKAFEDCPNLCSISLAAHLLNEPILEDTLKKVSVIHCPEPINDIPEQWKNKVCLGFAENEKVYCKKLRKGYIAYIRSHADTLRQSAVNHPALLRLMCREKLIDASHFDALLNETVRRENVELTAILLEYKRTQLVCAAGDSFDSLALD